MEKSEKEQLEKESRYSDFKDLIGSRGWKITKEWIDEQMSASISGIMDKDMPAEEIYKVKAYYGAYQDLLDFIYKENIDLLKEEIKE